MEINKIQSDKAYTIFSDWVTNAKLHYPNLNYQIKEVSIVREDLINAMNEAVISLNNSDLVESRRMPGYDYGFFCGFVASNLNTHWYHEYIYKQSSNFKVFAMINALDGFLKFDDLLKVKLSSLYEEYYKSQVNLEGLDTKIEINLPKTINFLALSTVENHVLLALEKCKIDILEKMFKLKAPKFLDSVVPFFTKEEVKSII